MCFLSSYNFFSLFFYSVKFMMTMPSSDGVMMILLFLEKPLNVALWLPGKVWSMVSTLMIKVISPCDDSHTKIWIVVSMFFLYKVHNVCLFFLNEFRILDQTKWPSYQLCWVWCLISYDQDRSYWQDSRCSCYIKFSLFIVVWKCELCFHRDFLMHLVVIHFFYVAIVHTV